MLNIADENEPRKDGRDGVGFLGVVLAVGSMWNTPMILRLSSILGSAICFAIAFASQPNWPRWVKLLMSLSAVVLAALMGRFVLANS